MSISFRKILFPFLLLCIQTSVWAQNPNQEQEAKNVDIIYSDSSNIVQKDNKMIQRLQGDVQLKMDSVYFYCDSAIIEDDERVRAYGNIIIQQTDSISAFADSLVYEVPIKTANLMGDTVVLVNGQQELFTNGLTYQLDVRVATYTTGATMYRGETQLSSKVGYYYIEQDKVYFKDSVIVIDPEFNLKTDTLEFDVQSETVFFVDSTLITSDTSKIYCERGYYDTQKGFAEFTQNAQFKRGDQLGKAERIQYNQKSREFLLLGNAWVNAPDQDARADTITYSELNETFVLRGKARFEGDGRLVQGQVINYDARNKTYSTAGRSYISEPPQILEANKVDFVEKTGLGIAIGNVIWRDTSSNLTIFCDTANYNRADDFLEATGGTFGRPLMITLVEGDTLFLAADTLLAVRANYFEKKDILSADSLSQVDSLSQLDSTQVVDSVAVDSMAVAPELLSPVTTDSTNDNSANAPERFSTSGISSSDTTTMDSLAMDSTTVDSMASDTALVDSGPDTTRYLLAFKDVRIYKSDLQLLSDSLSFNSRDSIFTFFQNPVMWSDTSQLSGDTIKIYMKNGAIDKALLNQKAIIIKTTKEGYYNQIKGRDITAYFKDDDIYRMLVEGQAESVYYAKDEQGAYVGVNKTECSEMLIYFVNNEIDRIKFFDSTDGEANPMKKVNHRSMQLDGFKWIYQLRPKGLEDLFIPKDQLGTGKVPDQNEQQNQ